MADAETSGGPGVTILVADDDPAILDLITLSLSRRGYRVISAQDGQVAVDEAKKQQPELVILDVMMPKMTGWEVARELRQNPDTKGIKIIMLTAIGKAMNEMTSPLYGADAFIDKPFEFKDLERTVDELLAGR